ncbi:hypothetical protein PAXRUDRAFT_177605 [Paxillus rubicundulus Ve08.2h10]|uniref:Uncharacterized protein n=1 Tax=Paxillus rubicundulus Ve08.2h10 TaxID=930991 RepID=A0A0D0CDV7_9AGAM|nr:hypothetical protein PAXRUDRAFT_177605 [Paxillus rubicundulus Ve08.2h10]
MSASLTIQSLLDQSANLIEGALCDLEHESEIDQAMAETWTHVNELINQEMVSSLLGHGFQSSLNCRSLFGIFWRTPLPSMFPLSSLPPTLMFELLYRSGRRRSGLPSWSSVGQWMALLPTLGISSTWVPMQGPHPLRSLNGQAHQPLVFPNSAQHLEG